MRKFLSFKDMPSCLMRKALLHFLLAGIIAILAIGFTVATKEIENLIVLFISLYFVVNGLNICVQWNKGNILEIPAYCASIQEAKVIQSNLTVIFTTKDPEEPTLTFDVAKKACNYVIGMSYVLYVSKTNKTSIIASMPVA